MSSESVIMQIAVLSGSNLLAVMAQLPVEEGIVGKMSQRKQEYLPSTHFHSLALEPQEALAKASRSRKIIFNR